MAGVVLGAVDNVVLAIWSLCRRGTQSSHVTASESFGNGKTHLLSARQNLVGDLVAKRDIAQPLLNGGQTDSHTSHVSVGEA